VLHLGNAIGHSVADNVIFDRQQVLVAMASGNPEERPAYLHMRPGNLPVVDGVAQVNVGKSIGSDVAHGGKAGHQSGFRVDHAVDGLLGAG